MHRRYRRLANICFIYTTLALSFGLFVYYQLYGQSDIAICLFALSFLMVMSMVKQMEDDTRAEARRRVILDKVRALPGADFRKKLTYDLIDLPGIAIESDKSGAFIIRHGRTIESFCCFDVTKFNCFMASGVPVLEITFTYTTLVVEGEK